MFSFFSGPKKPLSSKPPAPTNVARNTPANARVMKDMLGDRAAQLPTENMGSNVSAVAKQTNVVGMKGVGVEKRTVMGNTRNVRNWAAARRAAAASSGAAANASVAVPVAANASSGAAANASSGAAANASTNAAKGGYRKTRRNRNRKTRRNRNRKNRY